MLQDLKTIYLIISHDISPIFEKMGGCYLAPLRERFVHPAAFRGIYVLTQPPNAMTPFQPI